MNSDEDVRKKESSTQAMSNQCSRVMDLYQSGGPRAVAAGVRRWLFHRARNARRTVSGPVYRLADRYRLLTPDQLYSSDYYARRCQDPWRTESNDIATALASYYQPSSVIDFGCAVGAYLEPFADRGVRVRGVEGAQAAREYALVPEECITIHDLREPYRVQSRYDLALCIEVAEHIAPQHANTLVETVAEAADRVVWSAAQPGQGGTHHVNEQSSDYWQRRFAARGFERDMDAESAVQDVDVDQLNHVISNLQIFHPK